MSGLIETLERILRQHDENYASPWDVVEGLRELVSAHRAGQRTEHEPDLIDRDGDRWVWEVRGGYSISEHTFMTRHALENHYGPVIEDETETEDPR